MQLTIEHIEPIVMDGKGWDIAQLLSVISNMQELEECTLPIGGVESLLNEMTRQGKMVRIEFPQISKPLIAWSRDPNYRKITDGGLGRSFV